MSTNVLTHLPENVVPVSESKCECCCEEFHFESMVQCSEGHIFCPQCLKRHVEISHLERNECEFACISMYSECRGVFSDRSLEKVVDSSFMERIERLRLINVLDTARISHSKCPLCDSLNINDSKELSSRCSSCSHHYCKKCLHPAHLNKTCFEAESERKDNLATTNIRSRIAEAMTDAVVRKCPCCFTSFIKESGCNHITCSRCKVESCYLCRTRIKNTSEHFCQVPFCNHKTCRKCILFTNTENDDKMNRINAGRREKKLLKRHFKGLRHHNLRKNRFVFTPREGRFLNRNACEILERFLSLFANNSSFFEAVGLVLFGVLTCYMYRISGAMMEIYCHTSSEQTHC
jgi:hypothetical protein